jgi:hypothetical protein
VAGVLGALTAVWAQLVACALGIWLMAAPAVLGLDGPARVHDRVVGPLIASVGLIAASEVMRALRHANLAAGAWLLVAPWALGFGALATANATAVGLATMLLARVRGRVVHRFGGGWRAALPGRSRVSGDAAAPPGPS